jgi:hypothetical protein
MYLGPDPIFLSDFRRQEEGTTIMSSSRGRNGGHDLMSQSLTSVLLAPDDGASNSGSILMTTSLNAVVGPDGTLVHTATKPPPPPIRTTPVAVPAFSQGEGTQPLSLSQVV